MKKPTTLLIAVALMLVLGQCKKNEIAKNNNVITPVTAMQQGPDIERILNFNKAVQAHRQNPDLRTREVVDVEEAADDIADLFNATYTEPTEHYGETERAEFIITLPVNENGKVLLDDVVEAYEELVALARANYHASALSDKGYICMIATVEDHSAGETVLKITGIYGSKTVQTNTLLGYYDPNTWWSYQEYDLSIDCVPNADRGADKVLESDLMEYYKIPKPSNIPEGYKIVMIRNKVVDFIGNAFEEWPLFYRYGEEANHTCINGSEMDILYDNSIGAIHYYLNELNTHPSNQTIATDYYQVSEIFVEGIKDYLHETQLIPYITHHYVVTYGIACWICEAYCGPAEL
ncbi:MAG: hypothetical protein IKQ09_06190 [Bacteroidales bacterium]|nr:hypothetical protein [Bacteroidales bacterium]